MDRSDNETRAAGEGRFADRTYLICGASSGLGRAAAELILRDGGSVIAVSRREPLPEAPPDRLVRVQADLGSAAGVESVLDAVRVGRAPLDGVLVNGGGPPPGRAFALSREQWQATLDLLVVRPLELLDGLRDAFVDGASILFVTSASVREPIPELDASNVLRPGVAALANILSRELAPRVRVNSIAPGRISTDRMNEVDERQAEKSGVGLDEQRQGVAADIPLGRYGTPEEFAETAAFLLSPAARYVTGAALQVDGGLQRSA